MSAPCLLPALSKAHREIALKRDAQSLVYLLDTHRWRLWVSSFSDKNSLHLSTLVIAYLTHSHKRPSTVRSIGLYELFSSHDTGSVSQHLHTKPQRGLGQQI